MEERLVTVRTYAEMYRVTTECVRKWIRQNKVNWKVIDGVNFIALTDEKIKTEKGKMINIKYPIKFQKKIDDVTIEFEITQDASTDDFKQIERIVDRLHERYIKAVRDIEEERRIKADEELRERIKKNPCFLCALLDKCTNTLKGKQKCDKYWELPF